MLLLAGFAVIVDFITAIYLFGHDPSAKRLPYQATSRSRGPDIRQDSPAQASPCTARLGPSARVRQTLRSKRRYKDAGKSVPVRGVM